MHLDYPDNCWIHNGTVFLRKSADSINNQHESPKSIVIEVFETYVVCIETMCPFWHIFNCKSNFSIKKAWNFWKFSTLPHFWYTFSIETSKMGAFSYNMKIIHRQKWKMANLGHFMGAKTSSYQIFVKYVKIIDFSAFMVLPEVKKWVKIYRNFCWIVSASK